MYVLAGEASVTPNNSALSRYAPVGTASAPTRDRTALSPVALQTTKEPRMTQQSQHADPALANDELLTISEVAAIVRAPVATMRYWRHLGTGPRSFRLGRRVVYRAGDLQAWIDAQARISNSGSPAGE